MEKPAEVQQTHEPEAKSAVSNRLVEGVERSLEFTRYMMLVPVVILLLSALGSFVYDGVVFVDSIRRIDSSPYPPKQNLGYFVLIVDVLLVGATLFIAAVGFYELFVPHSEKKRDRAWMPEWLTMKDLNDLKGRVISMLILVMVVSFVDLVVNFGKGSDVVVIYVGAGVALTIVALTIFLRYGTGDHGEGSP